MPEEAAIAAQLAATTAATTAAAVAKAVAEAVASEKATAYLIVLEARIVKVERDLLAAETTLLGIAKAADRWKGGFILVVAVGAFIGWLTSVGGGIKGLLK